MMSTSQMATLWLPTKLPPHLPWHVDLIEELNNGQKTLRWHKGLEEEVAPFPCFRALVPRKSVQAKHGLARRSNKRKGESFETVVRSCISRAVAFSTGQFRAVLRSFSDSSAKGDVRCDASRGNSNCSIENGNGGSGNGGGGGSGKGSPGGGDSVGGNPVLGADWWLWCQKCATSGRSRSVFVNKRQIMPLYDQTSNRNCSWVVERMVEAAIARTVFHLTEPAVDLMHQALLLPFQLIGLLLSFSTGEIEKAMAFMLAVIVVAPIMAMVLLWLVWRQWRARGQGLDADGEDNSEEDDDRA